MSSKGLVLITGINGYIAARTAEAFLNSGYSVRGTARAKSSTKAVVDALAAYRDRVEIAEIKDITVPGAFDEAVKGVTYIAHLASPVSFESDDPEPIIHAAVAGTTGVLESALKESSIKTVVLMSSVVAVYSMKDGPYTFTEADWNLQSLELLAQHGKSSPRGIVYLASKTRSEQEFWKFRDDKKPPFTMTALNPSYVVGAPLVNPTRPEQVSMTIAPVYKALIGEPIATSGLSQDFQAIVDVRDVARGAIFAVEHAEKANGQRYLLSSGLVPQQAINDILRKAYPDRRNIIEEGKPGEGYTPDFAFNGLMKIDNSKALRETGQSWIPVEDTITSTAKAFEGLFVRYTNQFQNGTPRSEDYKRKVYKGR